jgi:replicative DNA helicase
MHPAMIAGRVPPNNLDAEAAVLAAIMLDATALDAVLEILKPEHFYSDANGKIYEAAVTLVSLKQPIDIVNVAGWLRDREILAQVGGSSYLAQIADSTPAVSHVASHAKTIFEKWRLRQLIAICQKVSAEGYGDVGPIQEFIDAAEQSIYEIAHMKHTKSGAKHVAQVLQDVFKAMTAAAENGSRIVGQPTGYAKFDEKTSGLHDGDLTIIAARPGVGKTSYVMNLAVNVASPQEYEKEGTKHTREGDGVMVFSLEMPEQQLGSRLICSEGRVDLGKLRNAMLQPDDWRRMTEAASYLSALPIWIDDTPAITLLEIRAKVRRKQAEWNREATDTTPARRVGLIVIDYLQLMKGREGVTSREQEVGEISRGLKSLAKELGVPVIALSQLNRAVEQRGKDKRPQLSDLRDSGSIEQDADMIVFIYRDEYYNPEKTTMKGVAELNIAKQRNGPTGKVMVKFTGAYTRFEDFPPGECPPESEDD